MQYIGLEMELALARIFQQIQRRHIGDGTFLQQKLMLIFYLAFSSINSHSPNREKKTAVKILEPAAEIHQISILV